ncbi:MAG: O-antigen ligase family protein [Thalassospira sp.]|uniref:O-antigen ligase family protein n=3 Tax=Thalassospira sp. TaxID=1912094 RepID=UPI001B2BFC03|nr:O-antigen ligase family protein [Thalassospira sp.]MBO6819807.1 O-antigen ligase family protein [Thalassospira sp.]MBO6886496.1 O-antigen ligase family protein [Thalassospira sp.]
MLWLAQTCLMAQIILAPLLLGGLRPWALAILAILTGIGMLVICLRPGPVQIGKHLLYLWIGIAGLIGWSIPQSLPIWPVQAYPFNAPHIALAPYGWLNMATYLIWLGGVASLTALLARLNNHLNITIARTTVITCAVQVTLAAGTDLMGWQTTFWFAKQVHLGDWIGSFANRTAFGNLMAFGILACLFLYDQSRALSTSKRLDQAGGWLAIGLLFATALVQSHSRLAFIMALVGGALFIILTPRENVQSIKRLIVIALGIIATIAVTAFASPELFTRFTDLARNDLIQRDDLWITALHAIAERPLTGWGADSIGLVIAHFATPDLNANAHWFSSHNLWLDGAIVFGVPVMLILLAALTLAIKTVLATCRQPDTRALLIALLAMAMLGSMGDWVMVMPALILPVVMLGMASFEAAVAAHHAMPARGDHAGQSPAPDPEVLR